MKYEMEKISALYVSQFRSGCHSKKTQIIEKSNNEKNANNRK